jgi:hypothetical protein
MSEPLKLFLAALVTAAAEGIQRLIQGGSHEDALLATEEALASARAKQKFPGLEVSRDG